MAKESGPPDINALMREAQKKGAIERGRKTREDRERRATQEVEDNTARPEGTGRLIGGKEQGIYRYFLAGKRIQSGMAVEFYANDAVGWVRGEFYWARKPRTPPTILVPVTDPDHRPDGGAGEGLGKLEVSLPRNAVCRWPAN